MSRDRRIIKKTYIACCHFCRAAGVCHTAGVCHKRAALSTPCGWGENRAKPRGEFRASASLPWKAPAPSSRLWGAGGSGLVGGRFNIPPRSACWPNLPTSALLGFSFPKFPARLSSDDGRGMRCSTWRCNINTQLNISAAWRVGIFMVLEFVLV